MINNEPVFPAYVKQVIDQLKIDPHVQEIWILGSQVNGAATPSSDWDILVKSSTEPRHRSARQPGIDVLWCGPSGSVLLEGAEEYLLFQFADFDWVTCGNSATYTGRKFIEREHGVAYDSAELAQIRKTQKAIRVWNS